MKRSLLLLPLFLLGAGCGSSATVPSTNTSGAPVTAVPTAPAATNEAEQFCEQKKSTAALYQTAWAHKQVTLTLPANIPPMPAGAVLCGTAPGTNQIFYYYKTNKSQKEVMDGFLAAYKAAGWNVDSTISDRMSYRNDILAGSEGAQFGGITYNTGDGELIFTYRIK